MLPALTITIYVDNKYICFIHYNILTGWLSKICWMINEPDDWLIYGHVCDDFSAQCWLLRTKHWDFYLFVYSLADDENYREGQVTFLGANLMKSYENPLVGRRNRTPSVGQSWAPRRPAGHRAPIPCYCSPHLGGATERTLSPTALNRCPLRMAYETPSHIRHQETCEYSRRYTYSSFMTTQRPQPLPCFT